MSDKSAEPAIFTFFPELKNSVAYINLKSKITAIEKIDGVGQNDLWIKRDDRFSTLYGGNKTRKLEFDLAEAQRRGKKGVVSMGGLGSNHGLATAICCRHLGLECTLLIYDQPLSSYVLRNLKLMHWAGANLLYVRGYVRSGLGYYVTERLARPDHYFIYSGGSSVIGTIGIASAVLELKLQIENGGMPEPDYIFCPNGSNGTLAGLILGAKLAGLKSQVIGVTVGVRKIGPLHITTEKSANKLLLATHRFLRQRSSSIPDLKPERPIILGNYLGQGYGYPTEEGVKTMRLFEEKAGIKLDPTYTAKTCAAMLDFGAHPENKNKKTLYWMTYNSLDLNREADAVDPRTLPQHFARFFNNQKVEK
jgi:1-aminocyclopropane-1-carboxylate deaminase/D-cysteine desulfhydrase-like pyridoxal-dependent ACC family enzyme